MPRGTYPIDIEKVKLLALDKGWSLTDLSIQADISIQTLVAYGRGSKAFPKTAAKIAKALKVKTSEIIKE